MSDPYIVIEPGTPIVPVIVSVPHCGIEFPEEIIQDYFEDMVNTPDDTDWYVHDLYNFALELGITIIHARYSRWVIDLNRDPESKPLYHDGRIVTGLTPSTDFLGQPIYLSDDKIPDEAETERRLVNYYWPYYQRVEKLLTERKNEFGKVLLWDAHSIRRSVPAIREDPFPDMILGDNDERSSDPRLITTALNFLKKGRYGVNHNDPFKGGHITRYFGKPDDDVHALQLEMNKVLYMDDSEIHFDEERANEVRSVLQPTFEALVEAVGTL